MKKLIDRIVDIGPFVALLAVIVLAPLVAVYVATSSKAQAATTRPHALTISTTKRVRSDLPTTALAICPRGYYAAGGGFTAPGRVEFVQLRYDSVALPRNRAWRVTIRALVGAGTANFRVTAFCRSWR